ncbi:proline dehydrogenase family protein [uncultured Mucilaginibacter sp.]|uniref:proline dehydrogenase family protein n=1 Tax=uncultured Mucilaginibacter sp. TaxID=797541 RepID=UPI0025E8FEF2|nr:proline dehydrogenase family protein [uncultured Mucilaginibacter sp.]
MLIHETDTPSPEGGLSFENTEIAFRHTSNAALRRAYWLFKLININFFVRVGPPITNFALKIRLPIKGIIRATIFKHFCGGETINGCTQAINNLHQGKVGTILDYSVEGEDDEQVFDETRDEIIRIIYRAVGDPAIPLTVFKPTGVVRFGLLEKLDAGQTLTEAEQNEFSRAKGRFNDICETAFDLDIPVMIDAEESWIQDTIDALALNMMREYNKTRPIVYNTYQLYRHDKLESLRKHATTAIDEGFYFGAKLVRGAYMEKERKRAADNGYPSPIQTTKQATDYDYNSAMEFCIANIKHVAFVAGTHNEDSCRFLVDLLNTHKVDHNHPSVYFSQLLGMSDNLSFNLADANYNVAKYVPYGPVEAVLPYLFRRAEENTAISGQMSRELGLIAKEKKRRGI